MGMKFESLSMKILPCGKPPSEIIFDENNTWKNKITFSALFEGDIILNGDFFIFEDDALFPGQGYLILDKKSQNKLPVYFVHRSKEKEFFTNSSYFFDSDILLLNNTPQDISAITHLHSANGIPSTITISSYSCNTIGLSLPYNYGFLKSFDSLA